MCLDNQQLEKRFLLRISKVGHSSDKQRTSYTLRLNFCMIEEVIDQK